MSRDRFARINVYTRHVRRIVNRLEEFFVATVEELQGALDGLSGAVDDAKARVLEDVTALEAEIENLKTELAGKIDPAALDPVAEKAAALRATVEAIDPIPPAPAPEPPAPEPAP